VTLTILKDFCGFTSVTLILSNSPRLPDSELVRVCPKQHLVVDYPASTVGVSEKKTRKQKSSQAVSFTNMRGGDP
jgi:hypothetical protein